MTTQDTGGTVASDATAAVIALVPRNITRDQFAVAALIGAGALLIMSLRKGLRGIGPIELTGSSVGAAEWFGYLLVVGGTIRVIQTQYPDSAVARGLAFIY